MGPLRQLYRYSLTPLGRRKIRWHLVFRAWPLLRRAAVAHRRTLASRTRVVVVVGSLGKTTTAAALATGLRTRIWRPQANSGSMVALAVLAIGPWQRHAVIEIGIAGPGQMARYAPVIRPDVVVVTAIASEHNRSLGSLDAARDEKAQILRGLHKGGLLVLNGDDQRVRAMAGSTDARVLTFGFGPDNDVRASEASLDWPHGMRLGVEVGDETLELRLRLLGRVMAYPVLAALAVAWAEGRPLGEVVRALESMPPQPGRMQLVPLPGGAWMIRDDFKSTLETIDAALDLLAEVPGRRIAVLGEISEPPGSQGPHYRRLGGRLGTIVSRAVIVAGKKSFRSYARRANEVGLPAEALIRARKVGEAVEAVLADLRPGDVVLVKGRDTQRLDRVALALQGRRVECQIEECTLTGMRCETCPMLERGWRADQSSARERMLDDTAMLTPRA